MKLLWIVVFIAWLILVPLSTALPTITTNAASGATAGTVTLNGASAGIGASATVWFEYGTTSGIYIYKTANQTQTVAGAFTQSISGMPLISGTTYYYRAVGVDETGSDTGAEVSFTTSSLSAIPDNNFDAHFDNLSNSALEPQNLSHVAVNPYTDIFGSVFWGFIYSIVFILIWMRQKDVTIPSILGLIVGGSLFAYMPSDWSSMAMSLMVVSFAGLIYTIIKGRG